MSVAKVECLLTFGWLTLFIFSSRGSKVRTFEKQNITIQLVHYFPSLSGYGSLLCLYETVKWILKFTKSWGGCEYYFLCVYLMTIRFATHSCNKFKGDYSFRKNVKTISDFLIYFVTFVFIFNVLDV